MTHRIVLPNHYKNEEHFVHVLVHDVFTRNGHEDLLEGIVDIQFDETNLQEIYVHLFDVLIYTVIVWIISDDEENVYVEYSLHEGKKTLEELV